MISHRLRDGVCELCHLRHNYMKVAVMEQGEVIAVDTVKHACGETADSLITVGYASKRKPSVVRCPPVVTGGQISVLIALILGNLTFIWKIHRAD